MRQRLHYGILKTIMCSNQSTRIVAFETPFRRGSCSSGSFYGQVPVPPPSQICDKKRLQDLNIEVGTTMELRPTAYSKLLARRKIP
jgi:hypothetical protein